MKEVGHYVGKRHTCSQRVHINVRESKYLPGRRQHDDIEDTYNHHESKQALNCES
jgi:hypothetical protein